MTYFRYKDNKPYVCCFRVYVSWFRRVYVGFGGRKFFSNISSEFADGELRVFIRIQSLKKGWNFLIFSKKKKKNEMK